MSAAIPSAVPLQLTAGDTATWKICLSDYSAGDGWALSYVLNRRPAGVRIVITASASGSEHLVSVPAATTAAWLPGTYDVQGYATHAGNSERFQVWAGTIVVRENFAAAQDGSDLRSNARKIFDALEAALLKMALAQSDGTSGAVLEWEVEGLRIKRSSQDLLLAEMTKQRDRYAAIVKNEEMIAARAAGRGTGKRILTRFVPA